MASDTPQAFRKQLGRRKVLSLFAGVGAISTAGVALRAAFVPKQVGVTELRVG